MNALGKVLLAIIAVVALSPALTVSAGEDYDPVSSVDFNYDRQVTAIDFSAFAGEYGRATGFDPVSPQDLNRDGVVDTLDFTILSDKYLNVRPEMPYTAFEVEGYTNNGQPIYVYSVNPENVVAWYRDWSTVPYHTPTAGDNYNCIGYANDAMDSFIRQYGFAGLLPASMPGHIFNAVYIGGSGSKSDLTNLENWLFLDLEAPLADGYTYERGDHMLPVRGTPVLHLRTVGNHKTTVGLRFSMYRDPYLPFRWASLDSTLSVSWADPSVDEPISSFVAYAPVREAM